MTKSTAMQGFIARIIAAEARPGVLSISLAHGFPWADLPETGARMLVIADDDASLAARVAEEFGTAFFEAREAFKTPYLKLDECLEIISTAPAGPIILADMSDNSGAGAPGDATHVLAAILERGLTNVASALYWDPDVVLQCQKAGSDARITVQLGGKVEQASGAPITVTAEICAIQSGLGQHLGPGLEPLGTVVWLKIAGDIDLLVNDLRIQVYHPEVFEQMGIRLADKHLVVVKSLFHFYTPFAEIAQRVLFCASPGRVNPDTRHIEYQRRDLNFWPRADDPFSDASIPSTAPARRTA